jgi:prepilin-type processing-associated H-X9-DG protein
VSLDYISQRDGAVYTLLLSENIQATEWATTGGGLPGGGAGEAEFRVGMVWETSKPGCGGINECLNDTTVDAAHARPSCRHGGGVVVSFCDGHQLFLREDIGYDVYQHMMTPDSEQAGLTGVFDAGAL